MPDDIKTERDGSVTWVVFNRPEKLNAFHEQMFEELRLTLAELANDSGTRVIVLRGAGPCFSVGQENAVSAGGSVPVGGHAADYESLGPTGDQHRLARRVKGWLEIWDNPKPVIAAVHGACYSHAASICVFCDITIVADDADIGRLPVIPLGGAYHTTLWAWAIGTKRAKEMEFVQGRRISGRTAADWGFANYSVPPSELFANVSTMAAEISRSPSEVLRMQKLAHNRIAELQGFRSAAPIGSEFDALLHYAPDIVRLRQATNELGYEEASRRYRNGTLEGQP